MSISDFKDWLVALQIIVSALFLIFAWAMRSSFVTRTAYEKKMRELEMELHELRTAQAKCATQEQMHKLELTVADVGADVRVTSAEIKGLTESVIGIDSAVNRIETHLLNKAL